MCLWWRVLETGFLEKIALELNLNNGISLSIDNYLYMWVDNY